ncbi:hypothetical protein ADILRU_1379 [Leifsonia rubra CMS 76R]|nr:hypothetical protein ADILRU_1379 [Leifsonia rubra CMS 76R]
MTPWFLDEKGSPRTGIVTIADRFVRGPELLHLVESGGEQTAF